MKTLYTDCPITYDGSQLSPLFAYSNFNFNHLRGDSIVFFKGPCNVREHMIDQEDLNLKEFISSDSMLHCIVEIFKSPPSLVEARMFQLLLVENATKLLKELSRPDIGARIYCDGDDIFIDDVKPKKMSVSIATVSGISEMIHFAVNITNTGIPPEVTAGCLNEINYDVNSFAQMLGKQMCKVYDEDILPALNKARTV